MSQPSKLDPDLALLNHVFTPLIIQFDIPTRLASRILHITAFSLGTIAALILTRTMAFQLGTDFTVMGMLSLAGLCILPPLYMTPFIWVGSIRMDSAVDGALRLIGVLASAASLYGMIVVLRATHVPVDMRIGVGFIMIVMPLTVISAYLRECRNDLAQSKRKAFFGR